MITSRAVVRAASRLEQEIRAYPRVHATFYRVLTRSARVRALVGTTKAAVRGESGQAAPSELDESPLVLSRRLDGAARRTGLRGTR